MGRYNNVVTEETLKKKKDKFDYDLVRAESKRRAKKKKEASRKRRNNVSKEVTPAKNKKSSVKVVKPSGGLKLAKMVGSGTSLMREGKGVPKDTLTASDRAIKNPNSKGATFEPTTGRVTTKGKWGKSSKDKIRSTKPDYEGTKVAKVNTKNDKYSLEPTTGRVTTKGKWGKSSKAKIRSTKPDYSNSPLSIKSKPKEDANATRKEMHEKMTALKNKRANSSSALKEATKKAQSSGKKTVSVGNKTYKVPAAKPTSLKGIEGIVARKRNEDKYSNYVEDIQRISAKRKKAAEKKKRPSSPDSKKNRRNREKKK